MLLDVVHMRLKTGVAIEDRDTHAGLDWHITIQYVLNVPTIKKAYASPVSSIGDLWVFLFLDDVEDARSQFYHQSYGFGIMDQYFDKPARVYSFSNASVETLETTSQWTMHVLSPKQDPASDYHSQLTHLESRLKEQPGKLLAAEQQKKSRIQQWYPGNDFDDAFVAITKTSHTGESRDLVPPDSGIEYKQSNMKLAVCQKETFPNPSSMGMPSSISELINLHPHEYGLHQEDDFPYSDTAYPMGLIHKPMSHIYDPSQSDLARFNPAASAPIPSTSGGPEDKSYYKAVVQVELVSPSADATAIDKVREMIGLHGEPHGLLELRALTTPNTGTKIGFFTVWETAADLVTFKQYLIRQDHVASDLVNSCKVTHSWNETCQGLDRIDSEWSPSKILELTEFTFQGSLSALEKDEFEKSVYGLWNTMTAAMSHMDDESVVTPGDPFWTDETNQSVYLFFVAWDGQLQREAWLRNFVSGSFESTGHLAHVLRRAGSHTRSTTFDMKTIYTRPFHYYHSGEQSDSDVDMGF